MIIQICSLGLHLQKFDRETLQTKHQVRSGKKAYRLYCFHTKPVLAILCRLI